ncbi:hypothetical protein Tco_1289910, partial [Tanacetum coccineum]
GRENGRRTVTVDNSTENALIAQDRIRGYDLSYQAEEEHPINYALMAYTSSGTSPVVESFVNSSEMLEYQENDTSISDKGYHVVPLPFTRIYMPPKPDIMFMDEKVKIESKHEFVDVKNKGVYNTVKPKTIRKNSFRPPIIKDWNSDDESEV